MNWVQLIKTIMESGTLAPDGNKWTYERIGNVVGLSKSAVGRLAIGTKQDAYFTPGKKLVDLLLKTNKEVANRGSDDKT